MDNLIINNIAKSINYSLFRQKTETGEIELRLSLFVDQKLVSTTSIANLAVDDFVHVLARCISHLEKLGALPFEAATARARAA